MKSYRTRHHHRRRPLQQEAVLHPLEQAEAALSAALAKASPKQIGMLAIRLAAVSEKLERQRVQERRRQIERGEAVRDALHRRALEEKIAELRAEFANDPAGYTEDDFEGAAEYMLAHPE